MDSRMMTTVASTVKATVSSCGKNVTIPSSVTVHATQMVLTFDARTESWHPIEDLASGAALVPGPRAPR